MPRVPAQAMGMVGQPRAFHRSASARRLFQADRAGVLAALLRAIVAPLLLIATVILSSAAAFGVSMVVYDKVFGFAGSDVSVPLYAFIFLVALGIDYNIFLRTRVREESTRRDRHHARGGTPGGPRPLRRQGVQRSAAGAGCRHHHRQSGCERDAYWALIVLGVVLAVNGAVLARPARRRRHPVADRAVRVAAVRRSVRSP
jgi:hypothetical protein